MTDEEYAEFYASCVRRLIGQVYLLTGDLPEAEDVVPDAFVRCWTRRRSIDREGAPEATGSSHARPHRDDGAPGPLSPHSEVPSQVTLTALRVASPVQVRTISPVERQVLDSLRSRAT
ncbi:hypothetical protein RKD23_000587 [Streptomyces sp. SAI-170]|uniref:hypothetical protein n=1 Tax=Streptomyces sp. SAI-170 TaxID=3377729 RepID=UPI003C7B9DBC